MSESIEMLYIYAGILLLILILAFFYIKGDK